MQELRSVSALPTLLLDMSALPTLLLEPLHARSVHLMVRERNHLLPLCLQLLRLLLL